MNAATKSKDISVNLSIETAVKAVGQAMSFGRKALNIELAVALAIFTGEKGASAEAKV